MWVIVLVSQNSIKDEALWTSAEKTHEVHRIYMQVLSLCGMNSREMIRQTVSVILKKN